MADNEPVETHPEVEPVLQESDNAREPPAQQVDAASADQAPTDESINASSVQEPKEGANAPEPTTVPNSEETNEGPGKWGGLSPGLVLMMSWVSCHSTGPGCEPRTTR